MILALDTSTDSASVALYDGESLLAETTWQAGRMATAQSLAMVEQALRVLPRRPAEPAASLQARLSGIAVALGPGSFNGLRVGLSLGKGLAYALQLPIVGVPTPDVLAYPFSALVLPVCALLRAGRGRVIAASFQTRYGRWQRIGDFDNTTLEAVCQETERTTVFCGEIDSDMAAQIRECLGQHALLASPALSSRRAGYLAEMGWRRLQEEPLGDDLASLQPIYLSRPRIGGDAAAEPEAVEA